MERRDPTEDAIEGESESGSGEEDSEGSNAEEEGDSGDKDESDSASSDDEDDEADDEDTEALRKALQLAVSGKESDSDDEEVDILLDEIEMDDEQMMEIDEKLAAVFRTRVEERKKGKGKKA